MCTITKHLEIRPATRAAYDDLAHFHYRGSCPPVYAAIYAIYDCRPAACRVRGKIGTGTRESASGGRYVPVPIFQQPVGVIVYTMPAMELEMRNIVIGGMFSNCRNRKERLKMINKNIRCISRVIIEPRYRGLGLASRLVRETMPLMNVPIIEAVAVMGRINPFFEKAGMNAYPSKPSRHCQRLLEALKTVGIEERLFIRPAQVQKKLDAMCGQLNFWLEHEIHRFLQAYGKRRTMPSGIHRTRFFLSKLTASPMYYIWKRAAI